MPTDLRRDFRAFQRQAILLVFRDCLLGRRRRGRRPRGPRDEALGVNEAHIGVLDKILGRGAVALSKVQRPAETASRISPQTYSRASA